MARRQTEPNRESRKRPTLDSGQNCHCSSGGGKIVFSIHRRGSVGDSHRGKLWLTLNFIEKTNYVYEKNKNILNNFQLCGQDGTGIRICSYTTLVWQSFWATGYLELTKEELSATHYFPKSRCIWLSEDVHHICLPGREQTFLSPQRGVDTTVSLHKMTLLKTACILH